MARFYIPDNLLKGQTLELSREESHHLAKVLRLANGDKVQLINGKGSLADATISESSPKASRILIEEVKIDTSQSLVSIAFGISKSAATETLIRRATEIGVSSFQPLLTQHSLHPDSWNEERWSKLIVEVCKQCEQLNFPVIHPPLKLKDWLNQSHSEIVFCYENSRNDKLQLESTRPVSLVIGSEGGFSQTEIELLTQRGAKSLGLGKNKLRVETASLVALVLLKQKLGEI